MGWHTLASRCGTLASMSELRHQNIAANGINLHYVEQGSGPLVLFCHGFPESWYSWRHQLPALAAAGFRAVALDMRGYGGSSKPQEISSYSLSYLIGDVVAAVTAPGSENAPPRSTQHCSSS